jgi:hypothetical protein
MLNPKVRFGTTDRDYISPIRLLLAPPSIDIYVLMEKDNRTLGEKLNI